ncbi:MAG: AsmA family protein, partial [Rhodospirillaceae bacterium]
MRKFIGILFGLVVIAVAAVLIGPSFVDWNKYTGEISRQVQDLTGRALAINGDIRIAVLPAPALVVGDIAFANADGAEPKNMATLKSAEVRVALGPLLGGIVQVETVKLIEPVLHLERLKDGRANWEFAVAKKPNGAAAPAEASGGAMPAIALDNLTVENATVIYRDAAAGVTERVEGQNARIAAVSLKGPLETQGSVTVRGIPLTFDVNVGELIHDRTVPFTLRLGAAAGALSAQLGGTLVNLTETPKFKGTIKLEGADLSAALAKAAGAAPSPTLAHAFSLTGEVAATAAAVEVQKLQTALGPVRANGDLRVDLGDKPTMSARLGIPKLDLNALLASPKATKADGAPAASPTPAAAPAPAEPLRLDLPKGIEASAILSVDAMPYRDGVIRDALVNATLAGGVLKVTQASAQFPGGSDLAATLSLHTPGGVPAFSAEVDSTINDLRGVFGWLGVGLPDIPADRLRKTSVRAKLSGTPEQVQIGDLDLRFDGSRLTGGVTVALRERLAFGANLNLDRLSVDAYMPKPASGAAQPAAGAANPFAALAALSGFDANLQAHVKSLVYQDNPIKDVVADVTLYNGGLDIRRLSVGEAAGALVSLKGKLLELGGVPKAEALQFETKIADLGRLGYVEDFQPLFLGGGAAAAAGAQTD